MRKVINVEYNEQGYSLDEMEQIYKKPENERNEEENIAAKEYEELLKTTNKMQETIYQSIKKSNETIERFKNLIN